MARGAVVVVTGLIVVLGIYGTAVMSGRSSTCMVCHKQEADFAGWMSEKLRKNNKGFSHELIACSDCHIEGGPSNSVSSKFRSLLHLVGNFAPQLDPRSPVVTTIFTRTRIPSDNCQYCHQAAIYRKAVQVRDLPNSLKPIGLVMDHTKHVKAGTDTCAKCHERYKAPNEQPDKSVNYSEVNHMSCDSCHSRASHSYRSDLFLPIPDNIYVQARSEAWDKLGANPRWMVAIPSEKTCRRCHDGKIHSKQVVFLADCREGENYENCIKCHNLMTKEYFDQYLVERKKKSMAGVRTRGLTTPTVFPDLFGRERLALTDNRQ
jgi:hypothetical protein